MELHTGKKRLLAALCISAALFCTGFAVICFYAKKIANAEKILSSYDLSFSTIGCIIKTYGRGDATVSAAVSFYTPSGALIGSYERAWRGWELNLECIVFKFAHGSLIFPYRLFSDKTDGTGIRLFALYSENGYPAIYDYDFFTKLEKTAIKTLFNASEYFPAFTALFSSAKTETLTLRNFNPDAEYTVTVLPSGKTALQKN